MIILWIEQTVGRFGCKLALILHSFNNQNCLVSKSLEIGTRASKHHRTHQGIQITANKNYIAILLYDVEDHSSPGHFGP